jgi:hypothetical protein
MSRSIAQTVLKGINFSGRYQYAVSTTAFSRFRVTASALDDRASALCDTYAGFRITGIRICVVARETTEINLAVLFNGPTASVPTTVEELADMPFYAQGSGLYGCPVPCLELSKKQLAKLRQVRWYNTGVSSTDDEFEYQFEIYAYAPFATLNYVVRVEYMIEFDASADPATTLRQWVARQAKARAGNVGVIYFDRPGKYTTESKSDTDDLIVVEGTKRAACDARLQPVTSPKLTVPAGQPKGVVGSQRGMPRM